jgi:hypothetical protein
VAEPRPLLVIDAADVPGTAVSGLIQAVRDG